MAGYASPTATHVPTTGQVIPAAWGTAVDVGMDYQATNKAHCRVFNSTNITLTTATTTALTFNSERVDVAAMHSTSSNTSRITVPTGEGGMYVIGGSARFAANATGFRALIIRLNGATILDQLMVPAGGAGSDIFLSSSTLYQLAAADYVELCAYQDSGGNLNITAASNYSPEFYAMWMST